VLLDPVIPGLALLLEDIVWVVVPRVSRRILVIRIFRLLLMLRPLILCSIPHAQLFSLDMEVRIQLLLFHYYRSKLILCSFGHGCSLTFGVWISLGL